MLRDFVLSFFNEALIVITMCYILAKVAVMANAKVRSGYVDTFIGSIPLISEQSIKNTFDGNMKKYLKFSNKVNIVFYSAIGLVTCIYLLMKII